MPGNNTKEGNFSNLRKDSKILKYTGDKEGYIFCNTSGKNTNKAQWNDLLQWTLVPQLHLQRVAQQMENSDEPLVEILSPHLSDVALTAAPHPCCDLLFLRALSQIFYQIFSASCANH